MSGSQPHCACGTFILFSLSLSRPNEGLLHAAASGAGWETCGEGVWSGGKAQQGLVFLGVCQFSQVSFRFFVLENILVHHHFYFSFYTLCFVPMLHLLTFLYLSFHSSPSFPPPPPSSLSVVAMLHKETIHGQEPVRSREMSTVTRIDCYILCLELSYLAFTYDG